jgi:hypothetical protein
MWWWIDEKGLVMDRLEPQSNLSDFDMTAGRLMVEHLQNGRLEKDGGLRPSQRRSTRRNIVY